VQDSGFQSIKFRDRVPDSLTLVIQKENISLAQIYLKNYKYEKRNEIIDRKNTREIELYLPSEQIFPLHPSVQEHV